MAVRANLKQWTLVVAGMAIAIIAVMVINQVRQTHSVTVATARRDVQQFTQILEANTDITFQSVTLILDHAVETALEHVNSHTTAHLGTAQRFIEIADNWALIHSVAIIDADGTIRDAATRSADGRLQAIRQDVEVFSQGIFLFHRDSTSAGRAFYITRPAPDLISGRRVIGVTKSVFDSAGRFRGVGIVTVALDDFTRVYAGLLPSRYATVELFRRDGALLASTNPDRKRDLTESEKRLLKDIVPSSAAGVYRVTSSEDVNGNLLSFRALERYPIIIAVSASWFQFMQRWWEASVVLAASALIGILVIAALTWWLMRRIGAEQRAKHALIQNERRILESQQLSGIGYYEHGLRTRDVTWSRNMYEIHGLDARSFHPSKHTYIDHVIAEDKARVLAAWESFAEDPRSGSLECRIIHPDGQLRHIRYSWKVLDEQPNVPPRVFGVAQDVTAMRDAENTIRDDEERLRDIVECSSDYIWELDAKGALTLFSATAIDQFGDDAGTGLKVLADEAANVEGGDAGALRRSINSRVKFRSLMVPVQNGEGQTRWVRLSGNPRFDTAGRYLGYRGAGTDVTELYHRQERDEAHRKADALGRLAGGMAHEINNLLQPIVIYANLGAAHGGLADSARQYFSRISLAAERSMMIVKNVLAFARQTPPTRENVSVLDVARETMDLIGGALGQGIHLEVGDGPEDVLVRVDRTGLTQILTNLLTNAAEATPHNGRIIVEVKAVNLPADMARGLALLPGVYCRLIVKDNGAGISPDLLGKVFDPFFTTKPQGRGTGLGLSVVAGLAKSWGGTVTVESTQGLGTRFIVYLPVAELKMQAAQ